MQQDSTTSLNKTKHRHAKITGKTRTRKNNKEKIKNNWKSKETIKLTQHPRLHTARPTLVVVVMVAVVLPQ